ncbi:ATP-binding protein [uncultured Actinomyces sp.]|uniref:ATP-binding protein n=1 Tax=uncultured Actinomyces sp. TaxID=249061 RepID=UPI002621AC1E|nr:ATP-binding protein [uncultured Actinomyces sp.]
MSHVQDNTDTPQGRQTGYEWTPPQIVPPQRALRRSCAHSTDMPLPWIGGVCAGISSMLGISVRVVRFAFLIALPAYGLSLVVYLWLWLTVPEDLGGEQSGTGRLHSPLASAEEIARRESQQRNLRVLLVGLGSLGLALAIAYLLFAGIAGLRDIASAILVIGGISAVWTQSARAHSWKSPLFILITLAGMLLVAAGLALAFFRGQSPWDLARGAILGASLILALGVAIIPLWVRTSQESARSKEREMREAERADMAAHLHDSVLQTLTLIRNNADNPTSVRALALGQERELRSWLYTGRDEAADSLAEALREAVSALETSFGVEVGVVTVSDTRPGPGELAMVAAASEAVSNAIRHAKPPLSVYLEVGPGGSDIYVKDCGDGFDLSQIPEDRHGVRNSIIGRMERAGGTATIRHLPSGTEVHLSMPPATLE